LVREFDAFRKYDRKGAGRKIPVGWRGVAERLVAMERGFDYYHGDRKFGFGGYVDSGLWKVVAQDLVESYGLSAGSTVLQIGCDYGFLLRELLNSVSDLRVAGVEPSRFALAQVDESLRHVTTHLPGTELPHADGTFDLVICAGLVYTFDLAGAKKLLAEIVRVGRKHKYVVLATYETARELEAFNEWTPLGQTILRREQWIELLSSVGYDGDVKFTSADTLGVELVNNVQH